MVGRIIKQAFLLFVAVALFVVPPTGVSASSQDDMREKVQAAVGLLLKDRSGAMAQLRGLGEPAVPYVVEILESQKKPTVQVRMALLSFISEARSRESNAALISLLSSSEPYERGFAAVELGRRKLDGGIPKLIALLNDKEIYLSRHITDPYREEHTLVRDTVIDSLQSITGHTLAKGKSREEQAKAWLRWWQKQQK
jgi:HEAT repeat protein